MNLDSHKHYQDFNFSVSKERFLVYMAGAEGNRFWEGAKNVGGKVMGVLGPPAKGLWYMSGGGVLGYSAGAAVAAGRGIRDGFIYAGDKVNEAGHYTRGTIKEVLKGGWKATGGAGWELAKSFPRDMWMSTYGVAREASKTYWEIAKAPVYFGQGVRQMISGLFGRPYEIGKNLLTLNFKQAYTEAQNLRPVQMLKQAFTLDVKGLMDTTRSIISDVFAPFHRTVTPIANQAKKVFKEEVDSNKQYYTVGLKDAKEKAMEGVNQIRNASAGGEVAAAEFRMTNEAERLKNAEEKAANEAEEEAANDNPKKKPKKERPTEKAA